MELAHQAPAGGAPLEDLLAASVVGALGLAGLFFVAYRYRRGGIAPLRKAAQRAEEISDTPAWSVLPSLVAGGALLIAVFGFYWDVSTHIDNGRDAGPFANPAHWFILIGLVGIALAGFLALLLGDRQTSDHALRAGTWTIPLGGGLILLCGVIALAGFPLDDVWHRMFGQDVTLWGPTHIQMVAGASLTTLGLWVLFRESASVTGRGLAARFLAQRETFIAGAFLLGLSTMQGEFDFGVPQFRLLYHPVLVMLAASIGLTTARVRLGRGGAIRATLFFLAVRGLLWLLIGPVLGRIDLHFPLFLAEALLIEAVAYRFDPAERPVRFSAWAGVSVATGGLAAEWAWTHAWMPIPWPAELLPEGAVLGAVAALAGAAIGTWIGLALSGRLSVHRFPRPALAASCLAALACLAWPAATTEIDVRAAVSLSERSVRDGDPYAVVTLQMEPPSVAEDALWFHALAWQGVDWRRGASPLVDMERRGAGVYVTEEAVPVGAGWKSMIRLHKDSSIVALPLYLPADPAIPAEEIPIADSFSRSFIGDKQLLQREAVGGNPALQRIGYASLTAVGIAWLAAMAWALRRLSVARVAGARLQPGVPARSAGAAS